MNSAVNVAFVELTITHTSQTRGVGTKKSPPCMVGSSFPVMNPLNIDTKQTFTTFGFGNLAPVCPACRCMGDEKQ